jgi:hypothetical protein
MQGNGERRDFSYRGRRWFFLSVVVLMVSGIRPLAAQEANEQEFVFARGLIRLNMPDLAERVMERLVLRHPDLEQRANVVRAEAMIHRRRLAAAEEILRAMPVDSPLGPGDPPGAGGCLFPDRGTG